MNKITLDPSIAVTLDIDSVAHGERVAIKFTADADWTGDFEFVVYNSVAKNSFVKPVNALTVLAMVMTLVIEPKIQLLVANTHYYEILSVSTKRVLFKGNLIITK